MFNDCTGRNCYDYVDEHGSSFDNSCVGDISPERTRISFDFFIDNFLIGK